MYPMVMVLFLLFNVLGSPRTRALQVAFECMGCSVCKIHFNVSLHNIRKARNVSREVIIKSSMADV